MAGKSTLAPRPSPIGALPVETLRLIFKLSLSNPSGIHTIADQRNFHAQRAVCRHWLAVHRDLALTSTRVVRGPRPLRALHAVLTRDPAQAAGLAVLRITLHTFGMGEIVTSLKLLAELIEACKAGPTGLGLDLRAFADGHRYRGWLEDVAFIGALKGCTALLEFTFVGIGQVHAPVFAQLLACWPNLIDLATGNFHILDWPQGSQTSWPSRRVPRTLRHLNLEVPSEAARSLARALVAASCASLENLRLAWDSQRPGSFATWLAASPPLPNLRTLIISPGVLSDPRAGVSPVLGLLPSLEFVLLFPADVLAGARAPPAGGPSTLRVLEVVLPNGTAIEAKVTVNDVCAVARHFGALEELIVAIEGGIDGWTESDREAVVTELGQAGISTELVQF